MMHPEATNLDEDPLLRRHRAPLQERQKDKAATSETNRKKPNLSFSSLVPPFLLQIIPQYKIGIQQYNRSRFFKDVLAGVTVSVMQVPLSMSYSKLAGLPPHYGLYAALVPPMVYPLVATSRQLAVGPAARVCLLLANGLGTLVPEGDTALYTQLAIQCSVLVGAIYLAMSLCQMGFITQFLSMPLISGFNSGAAILICLSQVKLIFGMTYTLFSSKLIDVVKALIDHGHQFNWTTFIMGIGGIFVLLGCKKVAYKYPEKYGWFQAVGPFAVAAGSIALTVGLDLDIPIVKEIPPGLPQITVSWWTPMSMDLWVTVISIVVVGFIQAFALSKSFAYKHGYELESSQELMALGLANFIGSIFCAFPVTGSLGQSAVNDSVGANSGVASVVTGLCIMVVLLLLTPVFEKLPLAALGATVIAFVAPMLDYKEAIYLYSVHKFDFVIWMVAFLGTIFLGVELGLAIAVGLSLVFVVYEAAYPHTSVLGRVPGTSLYRNIKQYPEVELYDGVVIVRINSPMFFANALSLRDKIRKYKKMAQDDMDRRKTGNSVRFIILDISPVTHIDTTALQVLQDMIDTQKAIGTQLCFANPNDRIMERLAKGKVVERIGPEHFFASQLEAVRWCLADLEKSGGVAVDQEAGSTDLEQDDGAVDHHAEPEPLTPPTVEEEGQAPSRTILTGDF